MSESGKERVTSDSGIDMSRKSRSGSFGGMDRSSFTDFDDSLQGSQRGSYDDADDYDDSDTVKVDLTAFMGDIPAGDDVGDEDEEEGSEEDEEGFEEDDEEEEDEGEYETEEETEVIEAPTQKQLEEEQLEEKKKSLKEKKQALINEYLHDIRQLYQLRTKNCILGSKILSHIEEKQAIVKKYVQRELDEQERLKEAERLKKLHFKDLCSAFDRGKKNKKGKKTHKKPKSALKSKKKGMHTRFSVGEDAHETFPFSSTNQEADLRQKFDINQKSQEIPDVSLKKLGKEYLYDTRPVKEKYAIFMSNLNKKTCDRHKYLRSRIGRKLKRFSFMRSTLYNISKPKPKTRHADSTFKKLSSKATRPREDKDSSISSPDVVTDTRIQSSIPRRQQQQNAQRLAQGSERRKSFNITKEASRLAMSRSRLALDHRKQEQRIQLRTDTADYQDLHRFTFEFADPRLTSKQASVKLRDELIKLLRDRHIPTTQLKWPLEIKGVEFKGKNPHGRVTLNYTRLSHHEKELPYTAYRILLTNMAFLRMKEQRMNKEHRKNMAHLESERISLKTGLGDIFNEIIEALRIFTTLCGISDYEKKEAKRETENFIIELGKFYDEFLNKKLMKLYKTIHSCEFSLRRLWISEGKGEGAELHEFKDIMRCREKLKVEHKSIERSIKQYQRHSNNVLKIVRSSGKKMRDAKDSVGKMNAELHDLKKSVTTMIEGMYLSQEAARKNLEAEKRLKIEAGILSSPALHENYQKIVGKIENMNIKRVNLQRVYNSKIREIEKLTPSTLPPSRFVRYKLRS